MLKRFLPFPFICLVFLSFISIAYSQETEIKGEEVVFSTKDDFKIKGTLGVFDKTKKKPAIILIHQGGSNRNEWSGFYEKLVAQNYVVLAYDVRGHGESDKVDSIYKLFNDPNQAPLDLKAAIEFLRTKPFVDKERIAVIGASIGANLAAVAAGDSSYGIKTAVVMSAKTSAVYNLAGTDSLKFKSLFLIASENDQGGQRATWAKEIYDKAKEPRKLEIVKSSRKHGVHVFEDDPAVMQHIIDWIKSNL